MIIENQSFFSFRRISFENTISRGLWHPIRTPSTLSRGSFKSMMKVPSSLPRFLPQIFVCFRDFFNFNDLLILMKWTKCSFLGILSIREPSGACGEDQPSGSSSRYVFMWKLHKTVKKHLGIGERALRTIMAKVLAALEFMHGEGLVHRNLRAEYVLIFDAENFTRVGTNLHLPHILWLKLNCWIIYPILKGYLIIKDFYLII